MYGVLFLLPQFLQTTLGFDAFGAGLRLLPWTATLFITAPVAGAVVNRFGERPLVADFAANGEADSAAHFERGFAAAMSLAATLSLAARLLGFSYRHGGRPSAQPPRKMRDARND